MSGGLESIYKSSLFRTSFHFTSVFQLAAIEFIGDFS